MAPVIIVSPQVPLDFGFFTSLGLGLELGQGGQGLGLGLDKIQIQRKDNQYYLDKTTYYLTITY